VVWVDALAHPHLPHEQSALPQPPTHRNWITFRSSQSRRGLPS
jgi:hypothetical protein